MTRPTCRGLLRVALALALVLGAIPVVPLLAQGRYQNFDVAIYIVVNTTRDLADPATLERQYQRIASQLKFDKVYLETYRDRRFADEQALKRIKKFFTDKGIAVAGGVTLAAGGEGGQFGTFDYENPRDREEARRAVELAARHFDEVILDDFFFYTSKSDADIAAKGKRSWTQYRLDTMREATESLVLKPAKAVNSKVRVIIKYPNWYEHFQATGYDLELQAKRFDYIYTGTETRDPYITDQLLQQYESYLIFRYFDNIRPNGGNRGGWVDTYSIRYLDRYAEQLWDTMFAKAPEITLFNWVPLAATQPLEPGERDAWRDQPTNFNWEELSRAFKAKHGNDAVPGWARAAGYSLEQVDAFLGKLGKPIGVASYKPYQSSGEDFLHNYLGNAGIPIELYPEFPTQAGMVLLTASAGHDVDIVSKIKAQLTAGKNVMVTSGLWRALQGKGIEDIVELEYTGNKVAIHDFLDAYGAGNGTSLNDPQHDNPAVLFPEIRFNTNDAWTLIRGVASAKGFPILLMNRYSRGVFYVLTVPDNFGDIYSLPRGVTSVLKSYLQADFPVRIDSESHVSLFAYDNDSFIVQSFRPAETTVSISVAGAAAKLRNVVSGADVSPIVQPQPTAAADGRRRGPQAPLRTTFSIAVQPHSYVVLAVER